MSFFSRHVRLFVIAVSLVVVFLAVDAWVVLSVPSSRSSGYMSLIGVFSIGLGLFVVGLIFALIMWAQKYYYLFMLRRSLALRTANRDFEYRDASGDEYSIGGHAFCYTITVSSSRNDPPCTYLVYESLAFMTSEKPSVSYGVLRGLYKALRL
jgi:hypothetical protein